MERPTNKTLLTSVSVAALGFAVALAPLCASAANEGCVKANQAQGAPQSLINQTNQAQGAPQSLINQTQNAQGAPQDLINKTQQANAQPMSNERNQMAERAEPQNPADCN